LEKYEDFIERHDPTVKESGLFFFDPIDFMRPEVVRYRRKLLERHVPRNAQVLLLASQTRAKPFHKSGDFRRLSSRLQRKLGGKTSRVAVCFYGAPFGVVPYELDEVYPLSQHETVEPPDAHTADYVAEQVAQYILRTNCDTVILLNDMENWGAAVAKASKKACLKKKIRFECINKNQNHEKRLLMLL
jgi:7-cyano-7-deazaguanine tRNA-ribosyltransferase